MSSITSRSGAASVTVINKAEDIITFPTAWEGKPPMLYIGGSGNITVKLAGEPTRALTFQVVASSIFTGLVTEVVSATATNLKAIW